MCGYVALLLLPVTRAELLLLLVVGPWMAITVQAAQLRFRVLYQKKAFPCHFL